MISAPSFTMGIEEEYHLVDLETRQLASSPPPEFMKECENALESQVSPEFLKSQIEIGTNICKTTAEARSELQHLRGTIARIAQKYNLAPIAVSTHPSASWSDTSPTDKDRYHDLARDLQGVVRRLLICGMHVHIGIEDEDLRIDIFNQMSYFLPHLLALSTSSPFWGGENTGLKSYRISVFDQLPRTGLPPHFETYREYERTIEVLIKTGVIEDSTKIWWDLRPSARFPTLEMRIADVCPRLEDTLAIASLYRCLCRMFYRLRRNNQRWRSYPNFLIEENRWRAQRYGLDNSLIDFGAGEIKSYKTLFDELAELIAEDAAFFDCEAEVAHARKIVLEGSSADRQVALYNRLKQENQSDESIMQAIVDMLRAETLEGIEI